MGFRRLENEFHYEYTYDQYLDELVGKNKDLEIVNVYKERSIYTIEGTTVEIAETTFNGVANRTVCVEHIDQNGISTCFIL